MDRRSAFSAALCLTLAGVCFAESEEEASKRRRLWVEAQRTGVCEVHRVAMVKKSVPIIYGLAVPDAALAVRYTLFPHAREKSFGGCCVMGEEMKELYICAECQGAEKAWNAKQAKMPTEEWLRKWGVARKENKGP